MKVICAVVASMAMMVCGCQSSPNRAGEGALIGGAVGAGAGAIIGHQSGHTGQGALLGGVLGALGGTLMGSQVQKPPQQASVTPVAQTANSQQVSIDEIITLAGQGVSDELIIDRITITNSKYSLTPAQVDILKQKGVSSKVIAAMQGA